MASPTRKCCVPPGNVVPLRSAILFSKKKSKEKPYIAYIDTDDIDKIYGQSTTYPVIISTEISTWVTELQNHRLVDSTHAIIDMTSMLLAYKFIEKRGRGHICALFGCSPH